MQRQLLQIADKIPDDITLTLLKSFAQILSREPEPAPKTPFIRAFAKIRDDSIEKQFSAIVEENEDQLNDYESGNFENENDCTLNYRVITSTEEMVYSLDNNENDDQSTAIEDVTGKEFLLDEVQTKQNKENSENVDVTDEGIVEMPKLLPAEDNPENEASENKDIVPEINPESSAEIIEEEKENTEPEDLAAEETENDEILSIEFSELSEFDENSPGKEPIPAEPPKVSLDEIEREIQEMQMFLLRKGVGPDTKNKSDNGNTKEQSPSDTNNIEDAFNLDVCINLKNRTQIPSQKKHNHNKYLKNKNYNEKIAEDGLIFDPSVPNTVEDFMKVKSVSERIHRKKQNVHPLDVFWQNLYENQRKLNK